MPHILIKHFPTDISREDKERIANKISSIVSNGFSCPNDVVSVSMIDVEPECWTKDVYEPDIQKRQDILIKTPSY
ncbi:4-oxalocrotonate tautomerase [Psychromonas sp. Urea-02u-13]|uniref:4-oxalocrotonate tautomerase n=1 Tax=Psychromonas sp. Urea-02u-13 TaxID=2058326 RepID=UPI000C34F934|nr:4-oxalocrotonate tautomerase [Psychromonas sp. Urea-02u-13]PKG37176.1 4-oxalocrotonate tautomerase [Psychromonas sp. Urea-02u-13]